MQRAYSTEPIESISYHPQPDGTAKVWLHENIGQEDTDDGLVWAADEVSLTTRLSLAEVDQNFDALWLAAERAEQSVETRLDEIDDRTLDLLEMLVEM